MPGIRPRSYGAIALVALASVLLIACPNLHAPRNGERLCGADASIAFYGYVPLAGGNVQIEIATSPNGPWTVAANITASTTDYYTADGVDYYYFNRSLRLPSWTSVDEGGEELHTFVRAYTFVRGAMTPVLYWTALTTYDQSPPHGSVLACLSARSQAGDSALAASAYCASASSPVVELFAPARTTCGCGPTAVTGDVTIDSPLAAAKYACTQQIAGSLTVTEGAPEVVSLPALSSIRGHLTADYSYPIPGNLGGNTSYRRRFIELPALTSIGGDATLDAKRWQGTKSVPNGLDAVTRVGGNITLTLWDANPNVFAGLTAHGGNLTIQGYPNGQLDVYLGNSFENLSSVAGNVLVRRFYNTNNVLNRLATVGGNLTIGELRFFGGPSFTSLQSVAGSFTWDAMKFFGGTWTNTVRVGRALVFTGHAAVPSLSVMPLAYATARSLRIENNAQLTDLSGTSFQVVGTGTISITGNPALSTCAVETFLAAQRAGGWTGRTNIADTIPCP